MGYTFYFQSDNIQNTTKDKARITKFIAAVKKAGHTGKYCNISSNGHSYPNKYGCTGSKDIWVCIVGGICPGTIVDLTSNFKNFGTSSWFRTSRLKKANLMMIFVQKPEGAISANINDTTYYSRAHDDNFSPSSFKGLSKLKTFLTKHNVMYLEGTTDEIVADIKAKQYKGAVISGIGSSSSGGSSSGSSSNSKAGTYYYGFDKDNPFKGYLAIGYQVNGTGTIKKIVIDWSAEAPDVSYKWSNSFDGEDVVLSWINNKALFTDVEILSKIQGVEGKYSDQQKKQDTNKYYIKYIDFHYQPMKQYDDDDNISGSKDLYDSFDHASYKMLLNKLSFTNGDPLVGKILGVSGKTVLDSLKTALDECHYKTRMVYSENRDDDKLFFEEASLINDESIADTFNEGIEGNVLGVSNITYNPISSMINSDILIYKRQVRNSTNTAEYSKYCQAKIVNLDNLLRYGESSNLESSEIITSFDEAKQQCRNNYDENFKKDITYTLKVVGLPLCNINDFVTTKMVNDNLSNTLQVESMTIDIDVEDRPMVQTSLGLGEVDYKIKVQKNLEAQRRKLIKSSLDINKPITYEGTNELWGG